MSEELTDPVRIRIENANEQLDDICGEYCTMPNDSTYFNVYEVDPPHEEDIGPIIEHPEEYLPETVESWFNFQAYNHWDVPWLTRSVTAILLDAVRDTGAVLYDMTPAGSDRVKTRQFGLLPLCYFRYSGQKEYWAVLYFSWGD